ncbi:MAG: metallophosphoesterase [Fulvivirga sp.]
MRYLIFSDIHGNLPAFEKMLNKEKHAVDKFICLGDVVNYGPWSQECVEMLAHFEDTVLIKGNHEEYFEEKRCPVKSDLVQDFFKQSIKNFSAFSQIAKYQESEQLGKYVLQHTINDQYIFADTAVNVNTNFIIGHSHYQFYKRCPDDHVIINVGSVGQNRKYIDVISYCIYDQIKDEFSMKNLIYNVDYVINEMKARGYPDSCTEYYLNKNRFN